MRSILLKKRIIIIRHRSDLFDVSLKSFNKYLNLNVTSLFSVCREYARNNNKGNIINFSSIYGDVSPDPKIYMKGKHKHIGYAVSKSAVIYLTKYLNFIPFARYLHVS